MGRIEPDANDVMVLMFNEAMGSATNVNTGSIGAAGNLTMQNGAIVGYQGLFDNALYIPGITISPNFDGSNGANTVTLGNTLSLSGWVFLRRKTGSSETLFCKQFTNNNWTSPFMSCGIQLVNSTDGSWQPFVTTGVSTLQFVTVSAVQGTMPIGRWTHIGMTWDGTTIRAYLNGTLVQSGGSSGTINYNTGGTPGKWFVGGIPATSLSGTGIAAPSAIIQDVRLANVVRPQTYFADIYYNRFTG